jgi:dTDP-4-dehydrorhamnose reductase
MRPLLITGSRGTLGSAFTRICEGRALECVATTRTELDIADQDAVLRAIDACHPWAVINAAGYVRVDDAERDSVACFRSNVEGPAALAAACEHRGVPLLTFSSDLVFDGMKTLPYVESDKTRPLSIYGCSKAAAEQRVLDILPDALVVRSSAFFGPWDAYNFATRTLTQLRAGRTAEAADDVIVTPTYVPDLVHACLDLLIDGEHGIWHLSNGEALTWADAARATARAAGIRDAAVQPVQSVAHSTTAPRPAYSALGTERCVMLPSLDDAIARWAKLVA